VGCSAFTRKPTMSAPTTLNAPAERPPLRLLERPRQAPRPVAPQAPGWVARWAQKIFR